MFGEKVLQFYREYRDTYKDAARLDRSVEFLLGLIDGDFYFLQQNAHRFIPEVRARFEDALRELVKSFQNVCETFSLAKGPDLRIRRGRWTLKVKDSLELLVTDMERWQRRFLDYIQILHFSGYGFETVGPQPRAALTNLGPSSRPRSVNDNKAVAVSIATDNRFQLSSIPVTDGELQSIAGSLLRRPQETASRTDFLVEYRVIGRDENAAHVESVIRNTIQILDNANPLVMHVLRCEGFVTQPLHRRHQLVLSFPPGMNSPRTLRDILLDDDFSRPSIDARVELSRHIATAVLYAHTSGLVHKSVRPEDIIIFHHDDTTAKEGDRNFSKPSGASIGVPFLTGFSSARLEAANVDSSLRTNDDWKRDLYSHPSRQCQPTMKYAMAHDIFSVGVILLEIGLWESLITFDNASKNDTINERVIPDGNKMYQNIKQMQPSAGKLFQSTFEEIATIELPSEMGSRFSQIVSQCLRAVEEGLGEEEPNLSVTEDMVGLRYIQQVLEELDKIRV
jgi:hypothetical protein